jgi:asparagine N-glycosylation enzyme membrane subunit Stt3
MVSTLTLIVLILIFAVSMLIFSYSGFYFGWMAKRNSPPAGMPIISNIVDSLVNKKEKREEDEAQKSFFS